MEVRTSKAKVKYCEHTWDCVFEEGTWSSFDNWMDFFSPCPSNIAQNSWLSVFGNQVWQASETWIKLYAYCTPQAEKYIIETEGDNTEVSFGFTSKIAQRVNAVKEDKVSKPVRRGVNFGRFFVVDRGNYTFLYADETKQAKDKVQKVSIKVKNILVRRFLFKASMSYFIRYGGTTWKRRFRNGKWKDNDRWRSLA